MAAKEGHVVVPVARTSPENNLSISYRKKRQCQYHWSLLPSLPYSLLPAFYYYKEPAAQGKILAH
jgi:hypothetical protein